MEIERDPDRLPGSVPSPYPSEERLVAKLWEEALRSPDGEIYQASASLLVQLARTDRRLGMPMTELQQVLWQVNATEDVFHSSRHVILTAPTSTGKSTVADIFLTQPALLGVERRSALYIAPTRALTQAKWRELHRHFHGTALHKEIVLSTGEDAADDWRIVHGRFAIACMVYEKANILFAKHVDLLSSCGCVVIDEAHMLANLSRGPTLEMAMTKMISHRRDQEWQSGQREPEYLRLVVISTEDEVDQALNRFLSVRTSTGEVLPPHLVRATARPIWILHSLIIPGLADDAGKTCPLVCFRNNRDRQIVGEERSLLAAKILAELAGTSSGTGSSEFDFSQAAVQLKILILLQRLLTEKPQGRRVLVFVPEKRWVETFARELRELRVGKLLGDTTALQKTSARLLELSSDLEDSMLADELHAAVAAGIFLHHSEIEHALRHEIELACQEQVATNQPSQVLFATETLSYGVNLAIDDVILVSTQFPGNDRMQVVKRQPLSRAAFHNMTGRCGRYGKTQGEIANVYIMPPAGNAPEQQLLSYYESSDPLRSTLFSAYDYDVFSASLQSTLRRTEAVPFSTPFVRSILDALRYKNLLMGTRYGRGRFAPQPLQSVLDFLGQSFYYEQLSPSDLDEKREMEMFTEAVARVLADCARPELGLVSITKDEPPGYAITPRGAALVDTGTDVRMVVPLIRLVNELRAIQLFGRRLPAEFYLLSLLIHPEVYRHLIFKGDDPRREQAPRVLDPTLAKTNKERAEKMLFEMLEQRGIPRHEAKMFAGRLRLLLDKEVFDSSFDQAIPGALMFGAVHCLTKFFVALLSWMDGESLQRSVSMAATHSVSKAFGKTATLRIDGWRKFAEQLGWRMLFLAKLLAIPGTANPPIGVDELHDFEQMAACLRFGCRADALPFFRQRQVGISRKQIGKLVAAKVSPTLLLSCGATLAIEGISTSQLSALRAGLGSFAANELRRLASEFLSGVAEGPADKLVQALWRGLSETYFPANVTALISGESEPGAPHQPFSDFVYELCREFVGEAMVRRFGLAEAAVLLQCREEDRSVLFTFDGAWPDKEPPARLAISFSEQPPLPTSLAAIQPRTDASLDCATAAVVLPWLAKDAAPPRGSAEAVDPGITSWVSPAGFALAMSCLAHSLVPAEKVMRLLAIPAAAPAQSAPRFVGVREVWQLIALDSDRTNLGLREALVAYYEVRPPFSDGHSAPAPAKSVWSG